MSDKNKVALVTGGRERLGSLISKALARSGYTVFVTTRRKLDPNIEGIDLDGIRIIEGDPGSGSDAERMIDLIRRDAGRLDLLVNNASSYYEGSLLEMSDGDFREAIEGCIYPVFFMSRSAIPLMGSGSGGLIVNIGFSRAEKVRGYRTIAAHGAAKTAVAVLTRSLALETKGSGIKVALLSPERIDMGEEGGRRDPNITSLERFIASFDDVLNYELMDGEAKEFLI